MSLEKDTVQQTLCIPPWCRAVSTERQPSFFPDHDAARILAELGEPRSKSLFYRLEYPNLQCIVRQYDMACEIARYVEAHPQACVVEMGAGLSCQRRQMAEASMAGARSPWYAVDLPNVIELRERLIPTDGVERRVAGDLNDFSWMDGIDFSPERGAVFIGAGLFYYFMKDDVRRLVCELARRFPGRPSRSTPPTTRASRASTRRSSSPATRRSRSSSSTTRRPKSPRGAPKSPASRSATTSAATPPRA